MICPHCGKEHPNQAAFCPTTGKSLAREATCPHCGEAHSAGMQFCPNTGKPLSSKAEPSDRKTRSGWWLFPISIFLLCIMAIGGIVVYQMGKPFPLLAKDSTMNPGRRATRTPWAETSVAVTSTLDARPVASATKTTLETPPAFTPTFQGLQVADTREDLLADIKNRRYLLVASDPNYAPQSFLNTAGSRPDDTRCPVVALTASEMQGFDVDVAVAIGEALDVETCFATPSWDAITVGSWADKWDISIGSITITTARQQVLDFSVPYYYTPAVVAVRVDSGIRDLAGLEGQALCAGAATTYESWLNHVMEALGLPETSIYAQAPHVRVIPLGTDQECAQAIAGGREDFIGFVTSELIMDANIAAGLPVVKLGSPVYAEDLAAAFDKSSSLSTDSLRAEVDRLFTDMHEDGRLSQLSQQWFDVDLTLDPGN